MKIVSLALLGALALGISSAKAQSTGVNLKVKVALTLQKQALLSTNKNGDGKTFVSTIDKMKVNNKALLAYMAEIFDTTWPDGAQLRYDVDAEGLVVTDKTGSNVLFNCSVGVHDTNREAFVNVIWHLQSGPYSGKVVEGIPGSTKFKAHYQGLLQIYYNNFSDGSVYANLAGTGLNIESISDKVTDTRETRNWNETFTPFCIGFFENVHADIAGKITASRKYTGPVEK